MQTYTVLTDAKGQEEVSDFENKDCMVHSEETLFLLRAPTTSSRPYLSLMKEV